jgi:hypothetical protein
LTYTDRRRPPRRRSRVLMAAATVVLAGVALAVGIAVGEAIHDNPAPGGTQSYVRTLDPQALPPAAATTVTVTVTTTR